MDMYVVFVKSLLEKTSLSGITHSNKHLFSLLQLNLLCHSLDSSQPCMVVLVPYLNNIVVIKIFNIFMSNPSH